MLHVLTQNWWAVALRGLASILFGSLIFVWPRISLLVLVSLFGAFALISGLLAVISALRKSRGQKDRGVLLLEGILGMAVGILALLWPGLTAIGLVYLIGAWAIVTGLIEIVAAVRLRREIEGEWLLALLGLLSVAFGLFITVFPLAGAISLAWLVGAYAVAFGILLFVLALRLRGRQRYRHEIDRATRMAPSR